MEAPVRRILLVDDHPLILSGVASLLSDQPDLLVVGAASTVVTAVEMANALKPDLLILDGSLPDGSGVALLRQLIANQAGLLALALTLHEEGAYVRDFMTAGARGVVLKRSAADELLRAVRAVLSDGVFIDPAIASKLILPAPWAGVDPSALSYREQAVMQLIAQGHSNKEASRLLSISVKTVETYRARAFEKLGITTRASLVRLALDRGWLGGSDGR